MNIIINHNNNNNSHIKKSHHLNNRPQMMMMMISINSIAPLPKPICNSMVPRTFVKPLEPISNHQSIITSPELSIRVIQPKRKTIRKLEFHLNLLHPNPFVPLLRTICNTTSTPPFNRAMTVYRPNFPSIGACSSTEKIFPSSQTLATIPRHRPIPRRKHRTVPSKPIRSCRGFTTCFPVRTVPSLSSLPTIDDGAERVGFICRIFCVWNRRYHSCSTCPSNDCPRRKRYSWHRNCGRIVLLVVVHRQKMYAIDWRQWKKVMSMDNSLVSFVVFMVRNLVVLISRNNLNRY
mmetsp:Transcript_5378/g.8471  ORF Transcript_5378/g.8471 Transcript_5378/m.8471 type:complete len:291 (+) Transcript_5378:67-939(+)